MKRLTAQVHTRHGMERTGLGTALRRCSAWKLNDALDVAIPEIQTLDPVPEDGQMFLKRGGIDQLSDGGAQQLASRELALRNPGEAGGLPMLLQCTDRTSEPA